MVKKILKGVFYTSIVVGTLGLFAASAGVVYFYLQLTSDLPQIATISDYKPKSVTTIYADDESVIGELYDEYRLPVHFEEIPKIVRDAFLAAEDANFYSHPGIDIMSIARAFWINLRAGGTRQGASTITQQIVKSLLLTRQKTYTRKAKEAILSYRLEKALSKDEIFSIYLNQIFLGSGAYGIKAAGLVHFHKQLSELSIAEAAYLAGLPQRPSYLSDIRHRKDALGRQKYVLEQMRRNGFITQEQHDQAKQEEITIFPQEEHTIKQTPYFTSHSIRVLEDILENNLEGITAGDPGGLKVHTTVSPQAYKYAEEAVRRNLRDVDKRQGWRGPITCKATDFEYKTLEEIPSYTLFQAEVEEVNKRTKEIKLTVADIKTSLNVAKTVWARKYINQERRVKWVKPERMLKKGDCIEVSYIEKEQTDKKTKKTTTTRALILDQTPIAQSAMVVTDALTGEIKALIGGYDYSASQFNRATQGLLQPGSSFKPFIYLAALEELGYTPASIVPDSPISMRAGSGQIWTPQNYDRKFLGPITLRTALQRSRNVVSVYLLERMGVETAIASARRLGISTPIPPYKSIALGTPELKIIELVRAYGAFATEGWLADTLVIKSIEDRDGNEIYRKHPEQKKVIEDIYAFLMANMMKGVVERGTAQRVKKLGFPVAGKTGTTNDQMDAWFVGYTPEWVSGVWVGFDEKKTLGKYETGGKAAAPAFVYFMERWLKDSSHLDFNIPDEAIPVSINLRTGQLASTDSPGSFVEYFKSGTEPLHTQRDIEIPRDYLTNSEF